ncbi:MAG: glycosyltransferase family 2 protein [Candidatus Magasanikbacteria bacterium]|jgi:GT2 family glycosyltransferase
MAQPRLTIGLLTWNGAKHLPALFESLKKQSFRDFELIVLDNCSTDGSHSVILSKAKDLLVSFQLIQNERNVGFAAGQNQIFALSDSEYYLALNQDIVLSSDCLEKVIKCLDAHTNIASATPKLFKWDSEKKIQTTIVDSFGLKVSRSRRVVDIKKFDDERFANQNYIKIFGVSGACAFYRRSAIDTVGGLFDPMFFAYKEDVDLAYRLNSAGYDSVLVLGASAYHVRTGADSGSDSNHAQAFNKQRQSDLVKYYSYRNHLLVLLKNEYWENFIIDFPWILWYELQKFAYYLIFDFAVFKGLFDLWRQREEIKDKRSRIKQFRKIGWREMREVIYDKCKIPN